MPITKYQKGNALTLTTQQAAKELGISVYLTDKLVKSGELRTVRLGKLIRIPRTALTELLEEKNGRTTGS